MTISPSESALAAPAPAPTFRPPAAVHLLPLAAGLFLFVYARTVCSFIEGLGSADLAIGLLWVTSAHVLLRAGAMWVHRHVGAVPATPRRLFLLSVVTWLLAGGVALLVHAVRYPAFPLASHIKLLTGYWLLGAGLFAQLEYSLLERHARRTLPPRALLTDLRDRLDRRLLESIVMFTVVPALSMVVLIVRYVEEGFAQPLVLGEVAFLAAVILLTAVLVARHYGQALRRDIAAITSALDAVADGRFDVALDVSRGDDLGAMADGINGMAAGLRQRERIRDLFGRFVSPQVAETVLRHYALAPAAPGQTGRMIGQRRHVCVLMADLRGFTPLSEQLDPQAVTTLLNAYFAAAVAAIHAHGGVVDKFIGDAVMAVFGLSGEETPEQAAGAAVDCAVALRRALVELNRQREQAGLAPLQQGIGVADGLVVAGTIGSPDRMEFTVIGSPVNVAARLADLARPPLGDALIAASTAALTDGAGLRAVGDVALKGVSRPVAVFTPGEGGDGISPGRAGADTATPPAGRRR